MKKHIFTFSSRSWEVSVPISKHRWRRRHAVLSLLPLICMMGYAQVQERIGKGWNVGDGLNRDRMRDPAQHTEA